LIATTCYKLLEQLQQTAREEASTDISNTNSLANLVAALKSELSSNLQTAESNEQDAQAAAGESAAAKDQAVISKKTLEAAKVSLASAEANLQETSRHCQEREAEFISTLRGISEFRIHLKDTGMGSFIQGGISLLQISATGPFDNVVDIISNAIATLEDQVANAVSQNEMCKKNLADNEKARNKNIQTVTANREAHFRASGNLASAKEREVEAQKQLEESAKKIHDFSIVRDAEKALSADIIAKYTLADQSFKKGVAALQKNKVTRDKAESLYDVIDIIQDNLMETINNTEAQEASQAKTFEKEEQDAKALDISLTEEIEKSRMEQQGTSQAVADIVDKHTNSMELLDSSMKQFYAIRMQCLAAGEGFQDRNAKRQEEIDSLKHALDILDYSAQ